MLLLKPTCARLQRKNDILDNGYTDPSSAAIATGGTTEGALYDATSPVKSIPMSAGDSEFKASSRWNPIICP
jgi:hypothetical protein